MEQEKINIKKLFDFSPLALTKSIGILIKVVFLVLLILCITGGMMSVYRFFFPKPTQNINQPTFTGDNISYTNIQNDEKLNEIGIFAAPIYYDDKVGGIVGLEFKRRF